MKLFTFKMNSSLRDGLNSLANIQDVKSLKSHCTYHLKQRNPSLHLKFIAIISFADAFPGN